MQTLLITGGSGYLGAELTRRAVASGAWQVIATYTAHPLAIAGAKTVPLDLRDDSAAQVLLDEHRPDVVIHTAYLQRGPDMWAVTAEGAGAVARAARRVGARLIHMSSDALFDGERQGAYTESDPPSPITPYGEAKAAAEQLVAQGHPTALLVRTSLIYGGAEPGQHEQFVLDALAGDEDVTFFTDELRCPIQVGDLAAALLELAPTNVAGTLNIAGSDTISRYEFARLIASAAGRSPDTVRAGSSLALGLRRPRNCVLDITRAQRLLATPLRGVRQVLAQQVE